MLESVRGFPLFPQDPLSELGIALLEVDWKRLFYF